jgi:subtilisin family serine protease
MEPVLIGPDHPAVAGRAGRNVRLAVVDSGVTASHDHVPRVAGGVSLLADSDAGTDFEDRIGHGTAVSAVILEKAPEVSLYAVRVFEKSLSTRSEVLVRGIDWAVDQRLRVINLSLGTANSDRRDLLADAVKRAVDAGSIIVAAAEHGGKDWLPGCLPGVLGVVLNRGCPRDHVMLNATSGGQAAIAASRYPRPIPGVPPERNLSGISFAVANVSGFVARVLEGRPRVSTAEEVLEILGHP